MTTTLVTAVVDLSEIDPSRRRNIDWYLDGLDPLLSTRHGLIAFVEPRVVDRVTRRRAELAPESNTTIIPMSFADLPNAWVEPQIRVHFDAGRRPASASDENKDTSAYLALMWSKVALLDRAVTVDVGSSDRYWWYDAHLTTVASPPDGGTVDDLLERPRGPLHATVLWETSADEYADRATFHRTNPFSRIAGGLFSVDAATASVLDAIIDEEIAACLDGGWPTVEESLLGIAVDRLRDRATLSYGPWESLLTDLDGVRTVPWHRLRLLRDCRRRELDQRGLDHAVALLDALDGDLTLTDEEIAMLHDDLLVIAWRLGDRAHLGLSRDRLRTALESTPTLDALSETERILANLAIADDYLAGS